MFTRLWTGAICQNVINSVQFPFPLFPPTIPTHPNHWGWCNYLHLFGYSPQMLGGLDGDMMNPIWSQSEKNHLEQNQKSSQINASLAKTQGQKCRSTQAKPHWVCREFLPFQLPGQRHATHFLPEPQHRWVPNNLVPDPAASLAVPAPANFFRPRRAPTTQGPRRNKCGVSQLKCMYGSRIHETGIFPYMKTKKSTQCRQIYHTWIQWVIVIYIYI